MNELHSVMLKSYLKKIQFVSVCEQSLESNGDMAAVPQAAFAARKVRENEEKRKQFNCKLHLKFK